MLPHAGGTWNNSGSAGVFAVNLNNNSNNNNDNNGFRASRLQHTFAKRNLQGDSPFRVEGKEVYPWENNKYIVYYNPKQ